VADHVAIPGGDAVELQRVDSAWGPLREPVFRSLWIAAVVSYTGTWMQNVGAGWLMTQLTTSPLMVSLVQGASAIPVFLVVLPAGALADMVDRRRLLLFTQGWMVVAAAALGGLTLWHVVSPWTLLVFTFFLGLGAVMNDPAWQAITPEVVSTPRHASAVALNSAGFNVARATGPALGGIVVAAAGSGWSFLLNAASFFGVIVFLCRWKRAPHEPLAKRRTQCNYGRVSLCARSTASAVRADPYGCIQRGSHFPAGAASGNLPAARRPRIRIPADVFWPGCAGRSGAIASSATALFRRWVGSRIDRIVRRDDGSSRTSACV